MPKRAVRQRLLNHRKQLQVVECHPLGLQAQQHLIRAECFRDARVVALYSPINNEVATESLFSAARAAGKQICYPRVADQVLEFVEVTSLQLLRPARFGVAEPEAGRLISVDAVDLIVVPGVAFDRAGHRLGYGKGFYDRELARVSAAATSVGLCYGFQVCDRLPREAHDRPVQFLATETEFIPCHSAVTGSP